MLFIHPMWHHESQRLGKQKCTPAGYALHVIAEMIGFLGLLLLFGMPAFLIWQWLNDAFQAKLLWLLALPPVIGVVSEGLFQFSWWLARRKGFRYDYDRCEASWLEQGERRTYKYPVGGPGP
jgi:hypothetical protein